MRLANGGDGLRDSDGWSIRAGQNYVAALGGQTGTVGRGHVYGIGAGWVVGMAVTGRVSLHTVNSTVSPGHYYGRNGSVRVLCVDYERDHCPRWDSVARGSEDNSRRPISDCCDVLRDGRQAGI